ncbi:hypothetical protein BC832DRAFT_546156 [Gaertneriomyces semiglobifer]|nr:hypothetical protein BC832DRAFT_546156 [Gaertneriomyces semiglobifer]
MDEATADVGLPLKEGFASILYEEDEEESGDAAAARRAFEELTNPSQKVKRRRKRRKKTDLTEEQAKLLGRANDAIISMNYVNAVKILHEVIKEVPNAAQAWRTLATVHEQLRDPIKAMRALMIAAELSSKDNDLWRYLGAMSRKLGHNDQAMHCYSKAIAAEPTDQDALWDRAVIYYERRQLQKALNDLHAILDINPNVMCARRQLATIYHELNDDQTALRILEEAFMADETTPLSLEADEEDEEDVTDLSMGAPIRAKSRIEYEDLNLMLDLYLILGDYEKALTTLKRACRRLQGRPVENEFDYYEDDREFVGEDIHEDRTLPIDIQVKLGVIRLHLDFKDTAAAHFRRLYTFPVASYSDLYFDVADAYMDKRMFANALHVLERLNSDDRTRTALVWAKMANCYNQLGQYQTAADLYQAVLQVTPTDTEVQLALADVYEALGDDELASELLEQVKLQARAAQEQEDDGNAPGPIFMDDSGNDSEALIRNTRRAKLVEKDRAIAEANEKARKLEHQKDYAKVLTLYPNIKEPVPRADFLRTARKMITRFENTKAFYPGERKKVFTGLNNRGKANWQQTQVSDLDRRLRPGLEDEQEAEREDRPNPAITEFQGLTFDQWYDVFVKFAYAAVMDGSEEDAHSALKSAFDANVFYHDEPKRIKLKLHMAAVAIYGGNGPRVTEVCRWFCQYRLYANDMYRLYSALQAGGAEAISCYAMSSSYKYFLRQLRAAKKVAEKNPHTLDIKNPLLYTTYGHLMQAARSYLSAIAFFVKAYALCPEDPLINLSLGVAHLLRAMQRKSENRHLHVVQGLTFIMRYHTIRGETQEASYNVGRAFHHIGLNHLAIPYYEKVLHLSDEGKLPDPSLDLKGEAAYNLSLIYISSGSVGLAEEVLRNYCTV